MNPFVIPLVNGLYVQLSFTNPYYRKIVNGLYVHFDYNHPFYLYAVIPSWIL